jgi:hypothetical protein
MKTKLMFCFWVLSFSIGVYGQEKALPAGSDNNELRFNLATAIAGLPEINYERIINANMGVGMALGASVEQPKNMELRFIALPYCRIYFGEKKAAGFFIEGNMAVVNLKSPYTAFYTYEKPAESGTNMGFGAAVGFKFLTRYGVIGEVYLGGGRLFGSSIANGYPRIGVCIGKRF